MLKLSHAAVAFSFLLVIAAGCSTSNPTGTTTGTPVSACNNGLGCGLNATCNTPAGSTVGTCSCYQGYLECGADADGGGTGDAGAAGDGGIALCVNVKLDNNNCGNCGVVCPNGETCLGGLCNCNLSTCVEDGGGSVCTDTASDPLNCGACGKACPEGEDCSESICVCSKSPTIAQCAGDGGELDCVDTTKDRNNCGGCGNVCAGNEECEAPGGGNGVCVCITDAGPGMPPLPIENCGGSCTDVTQDPFNCGTCGVVCVSGSCIVGDAGTGVCNCPLPYTQCGPDCVDTFSDINHCGSCDNDCTIVGSGITELACNLGNCYCGPTSQGTICPGGVCATLGNDPNNCGFCGNICIAPASDCINSTCSCADSETLCGNPDAGIPPFCIDTTQDHLNCGNCGNVCEDTYAAGSGCRFGLCTCSPGQTTFCADIPSKTPGGTSCTCEPDNNHGTANPCDTPSFATNVYPLLAEQSGSFGCSASGCHSGSAPAGGLAFLDSNGDMDAGMAYAELLGTGPSGSGDAGVPYCDGGAPADAPSLVCACVSRVVPGSINGSYLVDVLTNDLPCDAGGAMPQDDAGGWVPLDSCSQQLIQTWITLGAAP